jgi:hypothetical protein
LRFRESRSIFIGRALVVLLLLVWAARASGIARLLPLALALLVLLATARDLRRARPAESPTSVDRARAIDSRGAWMPGVGPIGSPELRRARRELRWSRWSLVAVGVFVVGLGAAGIRDAVHRPHVYAHLRRDGVRLEARFEGCGSESRFDVPGRDTVCRLSVTYQGATRRWIYRDDYPQFDHVPTGGLVAVLLDPAHPTTVYTVHDVASNDNSGLVSVVGFFAIGLVAFGAVILAVSGWIWVRLGADRSVRRRTRVDAVR